MSALTEMKVMAAPGPYDITGSAYITANGIGHVYIVDKNRRKIAAVWGSFQEKLATADLLAAAPDLYEALVTIRDWADLRPKMRMQDGIGLDAFVRIVLAKATGAQP